MSKKIPLELEPSIIYWVIFPLVWVVSIGLSAILTVYMVELGEWLLTLLGRN